jgi:hypothetical protein
MTSSQILIKEGKSITTIPNLDPASRDCENNSTACFLFSSTLGSQYGLKKQK